MKKRRSPSMHAPYKKVNISNEKDKHSRLSFSKLGLILLLLCIYAGGYLCTLVLGINCNVKLSVKNKIDTAAEGEYDCIIILGAGVRTDGSMSDMLRDRMATGIRLYLDGTADKILVTGDHGRDNYDEVNTMKEYAVSCGVPSSDVFMDHAGFSTYESIVRAREIFCVERAVVVTQKYHLYRALYISDYIGIDALGVSADLHSYRGQAYRDVREILARVNDSVKRYTRPSPTYLGDQIHISGDGNQTNDK